MKAYIYTGGVIFPDNIGERPEEGDLIVAADSGYNNARLLGVRPQILLGDFDSLGNPPLDVPEVMQVPPEKDFTDTQIAVETAVSRGADEIVIIGGIAGRFDHALSNLSILESLHQRKVRAIWLDGQNRVRFIRDTGFILLRSQYKYFSLIALDEKVKGVSIQGCKYPLKNKTIERKLQFAVSNEIEGNCALITVKKGGIYIIESKDA